MGAKQVNLHREVFAPMGYANVADQVPHRYLAGHKPGRRRGDPSACGSSSP